MTDDGLPDEGRPTEPPEPSDAEALEAALSRCLEAFARDGDEGLERVCAEHPKWSERLREKIGLLARAGLLPDRAGEVPRQIGGYRILGVLGRGAMGVVYHAEPPDGGPRVAVKTVAWLADDESSVRARERFLRETRAAAKLDHPNVVRVLGSGEEDGVAYLVMEHVEGVTLAELIQEMRRRGTPPAELTAEELDRAYRTVRAAKGVQDDAGFGSRGDYADAVCRIVAQVADALEEVHAHGIVHRDVKPSNILIDGRGRARLFDLGLAHVADAPALTRTGEFAGSPYYASPEQVSARRGAVDGRSDVYSLGATLYELLALGVPLQAENAAALLRRIELDDPIPLRERAPLATRDLEVVCGVAMAKDVGSRYRTAGALAADLRRVVDRVPVSARAPGWWARCVRQARRRPAAAAALSLLALVLVGAPISLAIFNRALADERDQARRSASDYRREAERNREVSSFWEELVADLDADENPAARAVSAELLQRGAARVDGERLGLPLSRAVVLETLGRVHTRLGRPERALPLFDRALALRTAALGDEHIEIASALLHLAETHLELGNGGLALALAGRCRRVLESIGRVDHRMFAQAVVIEGDVRRREGRIDLARDLYLRALAAFEAGDARRLDLADVEGRLGEVAREDGDVRLALRHGDRSLELRREERRPDLPAIAGDLQRLGAWSLLAGDASEAERHFVEALGLYRKSVGDEHVAVGSVLGELVPLLPPPGADATRDAMVGRWITLLGRHQRDSDPEQAVRLQDRAILHLDAAGESARIDAAAARVERATLLVAAGRSEEAARDLSEAADRSDAETTEARAVRARALGLAVASARLRGDVEAAFRAQRTLVLLRSEPGAAVAPEDVARDMGRLAELCRMSGRPGEAASWDERASRRLLLASPPPDLASDLRLDPAYPLRVADDVTLREYDAAFQRGISALQAGGFAEAAGWFEECARLVPGVPVCSFNIACAWSLAGDRAAAMSALERAVDAGFGFRAADVELLTTDSDLASLRDAAGFGALLGRVRAWRADVERYSAEASFHVPKHLDPTERAPLLLVLHRHGATREEVVSGRWREVADRLGTILVAPSGAYPVPGRGAPSEGMTWVEDLERYRSRFLFDERPVTDALLEARRRYRIDPARVVIAGEGLGGTLAFNVAVRAPGLFRGVLMTGGSVHLDLARARAELLDDMRLGVAIVPDPDRPVEGLAGELDPLVHAARLAEVLRDLGVHATTIDPANADDETTGLVRGAGALLRSE